MFRTCMTKTGTAGGLALLALVSLAAMPAAAQDAAPADEWTTAEAAGPELATATPEEICEAQQRTQERTRKWLEEGVPEEFGSEEPFTFDPSTC